MIYKIKKYLRMRRLKKEITYELLETMVSICLYLLWNRGCPSNPYAPYMRSHARYLKELAMEFRRLEGIMLRPEGVRNDLL